MSTKHIKGRELSFAVSKPKKPVEKQGLNQTRTSCTPNVVSDYGPYLKSQMSKTYKIGVVGKKIQFSTISLEIKIVEFTRFLPQIYPVIFREERNTKQRRKFSSCQLGDKKART